MSEINVSQARGDLETAIIRAVLFFNLFDYPLTAFEVWRYLSLPASLGEVQKILVGGILGLEERDGFYYLAGREKIVAERAVRYHESHRKYEIARRNIRLLKHLPGVRAIFVVNLIGAHNWRATSDIDFLVISRPGRIWTSRFFSAGLMKIFSRRPRVGNKRDKICLSFYVSAARLDLSELRLKDFDPYFTYWLADLVPVFGQSWYPKLMAENSWLPKELPNWAPYYSDPQQSFELESRSGGGSFWEKVLRRWQLNIMPPALKHPGNDSGVLISDDILKLYVVDRRPEIAARCKQSYENFLG